MTISHGFRLLATSLEQLETNGVEVLDVATTDDERDRRLTVELTVSVPFDTDGEATTRSASDDESVDEGATHPGDEDAREESTDVRDQVLDPLPVRDEATNGASKPSSGSASDVTASDAPRDGSTGGEPSAERSDAALDEDSPPSDGAAESDVVTCPIGDCDATFESDHGMKIHRTKVHRHAEDADVEDVPAYRDPDRLQEVYDACDSFTEMHAALETDVSAQTVRRQMIAHGIYEPGSGDDSPNSDAGDDGSQDENVDVGATRDAVNDDGDDGTTAESPAEEASGDVEDDPVDAPEPSDIELPEGVTVTDLKTAVVDAKTLYDVQQHFGLERGEAMQLLEKYDLLNIVHGRVSDRDARKEVDEDEITRRILEHVPTGQAPSA